MSLEKIKKAMADRKLCCPNCRKPIDKWEKYVDLVDSIWDGAGDSRVEFSGCKVTLICQNPPCCWQERTQYWQNYLED